MTAPPITLSAMMITTMMMRITTMTAMSAAWGRLATMATLIVALPRRVPVHG